MVSLNFDKNSTWPWYSKLKTTEFVQKFNLTAPSLIENCRILTKFHNDYDILNRFAEKLNHHSLYLINKISTN